MKPKIIPGGRFVDDRGVLLHNNNFSFTNIVRSYTIKHDILGFVRAYHGHRFEDKYVQVIDGRFKIHVARMDNDALISDSTYILEDNGNVLYIPGYYSHGFQNISESGIINFYSTSDVEESISDDIRHPWTYFGSKIWDLKDYR